jgi:hypothetical protein
MPDNEERAASNVATIDPSIACFYDPEWLGYVIGMRELWKSDAGADINLRVCAIWTRGAEDQLLRTRLMQVYVLLQDVRRHYHADRVENTRRFKKVGAFRDTVQRLLEERSDQPLVVPDADQVEMRFAKLGGVIKDMVVVEMRMRFGMHWYRAHHTAIEQFLRRVGGLA